MKRPLSYFCLEHEFLFYEGERCLQCSPDAPKVETSNPEVQNELAKRDLVKALRDWANNIESGRIVISDFSFSTFSSSTTGRMSLNVEARDITVPLQKDCP